MPSYFRCEYRSECEGLLQLGTVCEHQRYPFDTYAAYDHAMALMQENKDFERVKLGEDREVVGMGWYYLFERGEDGITRVFSVTPRFIEPINASNLCDYFSVGQCIGDVPMSKKVVLDHKVFASMSEAARYCDVSRSTVQRAVRKGESVWCCPLQKYVRPQVVAEGEVLETIEVKKAVCDVLQIECPHCGRYHDVKVSLL